MNKTLVVDDNASFIAAIEPWVARQGLRGISFFTSLADARSAAANENFDRIIADYVFEGEDDSGLQFLEDVKVHSPRTELILLSGQNLSSNTERRLDEIGATLVKKSWLDYSFVGRLLGNEPLSKVAMEQAEDIDIGELRLRLESLETAWRETVELNDLLTEDIISELSKVRDQRKKALLIGHQLLSAEDLKREVQEKTPIGRELIRLHHKLFRKLRGEAFTAESRLAESS